MVIFQYIITMLALEIASVLSMVVALETKTNSGPCLSVIARVWVSFFLQHNYFQQRQQFQSKFTTCVFIISYCHYHKKASSSIP